MLYVMESIRITLIVLTVHEYPPFIGTTPNWMACGSARINANTQTPMMNLMALDNFDIVCCLHTFNQIEREKQKIKHEKKKKMKKGVLNIHIGHMVLMECEVES